MTEAFAELPLAIFTTLAAMGVGAYLSLAIAYFMGKITPEGYKSVAKFSIIPLGLMVVGVIASFMHLANPGNAMNVLSTIGSTPMGNEIGALILFGVVAALYWLAGGFANMGEAAHKIMIVVLAVIGLFAALMMGMAYMLETIPSWNTIFTPMSMLGFALFGGSAVAVLTLAMAESADAALDVDDCANAIVAINILGFAVAALGVIGIFMAASGCNAAAAGETLVFVIIAVILMAVCVGMFFAAAKIAPWKSVSIILAVLVAIAIFLARLAFYGVQIGIGL